jgi:hypothetical protein
MCIDAVGDRLHLRCITDIIGGFLILSDLISTFCYHALSNVQSLIFSGSRLLQHCVFAYQTVFSAKSYLFCASSLQYRTAYLKPFSLMPSLFCIHWCKKIGFFINFYIHTLLYIKY